jgi:hypothetical protein
MGISLYSLVSLNGSKIVFSMRMPMNRIPSPLTPRRLGIQMRTRQLVLRGDTDEKTQN